MTPDRIVEALCAVLPGVVPKSSWGETSLFYNPGLSLPSGVYFCTIKQHDGENDQASRLNRDGVFRLAIGLKPLSYVGLFGNPPERPAKGGHCEMSLSAIGCAVFTERLRSMLQYRQR
jgi:Family of unknown function (DUF6194)